MSMYRTLLQSRYRLVLILVGLFVGLSMLTRVVLLAVDHELLRQHAPGAITEALAAGLAYDVLVALWLAAPLALWLTLVPERWIERPWHRRLMAIGISLAVFFGAFVAASEYFFFDEFNGRFNFVAVDYLIYPTEVVTNIWQSYHVGWAVAIIALLTWGVWRLMRAPVTRALALRPSRLQRGLFIGGFALLLGVLSTGVTPALANVSEDRALNEVAANGYYTFFQALLGVDAPYEGWYATAPGDPVPRLQQLVTGPGTDTASFRAGTTLRRERGTAAPRPRPLNVVVVLEESFGAKFVGALGAKEPVTPRFDSLAAEGTLLTRAYSTGNRTIRALEATTTSLPPLPGVAIVRRAASRDLFTLPTLLRGRGYRTMFVYGGRALFDNMGAYMRDNGMERVIEQKDFPDTSFTTAWGVSDEAIFDKALAEMDTLHAGGAPFFVQVLTVSNHKPYTYPTGRIALDPAKQKRRHAVAYADWALGRFMRQARAHAWFDNTVFVIMGDHGARVYGAQEIPLPSYEVPVLFYAPGIVPAGARVATMASLLDIPPTVMGLLGGAYESKFFGTDVLRASPAEGRAFMTHNSSVALMRGDRMAVLGLRQAADLFQVDTVGNRLLRITSPDSSGRALLAEAITWYEGADRLYRSGKQGAR